MLNGFDNKITKLVDSKSSLFGLSESAVIFPWNTTVIYVASMEYNVQLHGDKGTFCEIDHIM